MRRHDQQYRSRMEAETLTLCLELIRAGLGYTVMPSCALHGQINEDGPLTAAPIKGLFLTWALHVNRTCEHSVAVRTTQYSMPSRVADSASRRARTRRAGTSMYVPRERY